MQLRDLGAAVMDFVQFLHFSPAQGHGDVRPQLEKSLAQEPVETRKMVIHPEVHHLHTGIERKERLAALLLGSDDCHLVTELGNKDIGFLRKYLFHTPGIIQTVNDIDYLHFIL